MESNILTKLNELNNFHLSFKVVQSDSLEFLLELQNRLSNCLVIKDGDDVFESLYYAYTNGIKNILADSSIDILLPMCTVLFSNTTSIIKPIVPVYYMIKDNKLVADILTTIHKLDNVELIKFKEKEKLIDKVLDTLGVKEGKDVL